MDVRAMRRAATEWLQLQAFEHTQMNATQSGIFGGQGNLPLGAGGRCAPGAGGCAGPAGAQNPNMSIHEWQRQQAEAARLRQQQAQQGAAAAGRKKGGLIQGLVGGGAKAKGRQATGRGAATAAVPADAASYPAESDSEDDGADPPLVEDGRGGLRRAGASKQSRTVKAAAADAACSAAQGAFGIFQAWGGGSICDVPEKKNRTKPINGQATSAVGGAANRAMGAMGPMGAMGAMCGAAGGGAGKRSCRCPYEAKCFYKGASTGNLPAATRADAIASGLANMRGKVGGKRFDKALEAFSVW